MVMNKTLWWSKTCDKEEKIYEKPNPDLKKLSYKKYTQKIVITNLQKWWKNSKTQIVTKLKNSIFNKIQTRITTKLKNSNCDQAKKIKLWQISKTVVTNSISDKTKQKVFWKTQFNTSTTDEWFSGQPFAILQCFFIHLPFNLCSV